MSDHVIRRGLDIPIAGRAAGEIVQLEPPDTVGYAPTEFRGVIPKPAVREGDSVERGAPLFFHKAHPSMVFRSPAAGTVREIRRGRRRVITDVVVEVSGGDATPLERYTLEDLRKLDRAGAIEVALASGWWPALSTRPLDKVPVPTRTPQSILIGAMETGPLQPGPQALLAGDDADALQAAITLFGRITPKVHLAVQAGAAHPALDRLEGIERHTFSGPHPAGDPGVQVNLVDPPRGGQEVWTIRAWDAAALGRTLLSGEFAAERVYAAVGKGVAEPRLVRTLLGAPLRHVVGGVTEGEHRWIRGSVLTGEAVSSERWAPFRSRAVHVLPSEVPRTLFGWALPMFGTWSFHRAFLSGLVGARPEGGIDMRPGLWGGERAIIPIGVYDRVVATPDILPEFLFKSIKAGDLEESIQLGLLDITGEEAALCTYICPSKFEFDVLLREGLEHYEKES
ncbi:MAG TPA: NADH:ubiquinone reductase (Na(+)-transporting) subunit A [Deltaproteobacteria bacterium]|nr:NADH:ubiquinone reductase (Na(+)-transporting) subunit A [Deltaproteobacteria bacterium]